jgi:hypothetical protein
VSGGANSKPGSRAQRDAPRPVSMPRRRRLSRKARRGLIRSAVELARGFFVSEHGREPTAREIAGRLNTDTKLLADIVGRRRSVRESDLIEHIERIERRQREQPDAPEPALTTRGSAEAPSKESDIRDRRSEIRRDRVYESTAGQPPRPNEIGLDAQLLSRSGGPCREPWARTPGQCFSKKRPGLSPKNSAVGNREFSRAGFLCPAPARHRDRIRELDRLAADYFGREIGDITNLSSDDCDAMRRGAGSHDARPRPRTAFPDPGTKTAEP